MTLKQLVACVAFSISGCGASIAASSEADRANGDTLARMQEYAVAVCLAGAYRNTLPADHGAIIALRDEQWAVVENTNHGPEVYAAIHEAAFGYGSSVPPEAGVRACLRWSRTPDFADLIGKLSR